MNTKNHKYCRPPWNAYNIEKLYEDGHFRQDNGKPGLAFAYLIPSGLLGTPFCGAVQCSCDPFDKNCPHTIGMNYVSSKRSCANGYFLDSLDTPQDESEGKNVK